MLDIGTLKDRLGTDTGLLQDDGRLDGSSRDDDLTSSVGGVGGSLFISELDTGSSWSRVGGEDDLSDVGTGKDCTWSVKASVGHDLELTGEIRSGLLIQIPSV